MPFYYHVHRTPTPSKIEKTLKTTQALFLSKKKSFWYTVEKQIGKDDYGGYIIYEVCIPPNQFTSSFAPNTSDKIVKITQKNVKEYINLKNEHRGSIKFFGELKSRRLIGYDATSPSIQKYAHKMSMFHEPELAIFDFTHYKPAFNVIEKHKTVNKGSPKNGFLNKY